MSRIFTRKDGVVLFETEDKLNRATFKADTNKDLALDNQSSPIEIIDAYKDSPIVGWSPCNIDIDTRGQWEKEILELSNG